MRLTWFSRKKQNAIDNAISGLIPNSREEYDNYPATIVDVVNNSVTASAAAKLMTSYIIGKGVSYDIEVNKGVTINKLIKSIARSITLHGGVFIQVNYNINHAITSLEALPFENCRLGKKDDDDYNGKIIVSKEGDWSNKNKLTAIDVYNSDSNVIAAQIKEAKGIENYKGQIYYYNDSDEVYPLSRLHPCILDAKSEKEASIYKNVSLESGFFGKTLVLTKPLVNRTLPSENEDRILQESGRSRMESELKKLLGSKNSDGVLLMESADKDSSIRDMIEIKQIQTNINDKLFSYTESSASDNIRMCFNNIPASLIRSQEGAMFGSSGEAYQQMVQFYQSQTEEERAMVEEILNELMPKFKTPLENLKIEKLYANS